MRIPQRKLALITLVLYWPALIIFAHMPVPKSVLSANVSDKDLHFQAYLVLAFLVWFSVKPYEKVNWRKLPAWLIFFGLTAYGAIDEVIQSFIGRSCDVMDLVTNVISISFCLLLLTFLSFQPAALLVSGIVIFGISNVSKTDLTDLFPLAYGIFNFVSYSILTLFWILNIDLIFTKKPEKLKWLLITVAMPIFFLLMVRFSSFLLGRTSNKEDFIIPITAIITITAAWYLLVFALSKRIKPNCSSV